MQIKSSVSISVPALSFRLINYENHKEQLQGVPCIPIEDLAVVFYHGTSSPAEEKLVSDQEMEGWKLSVGMLYRRALQTCVRVRPAKLESLYRMIGLSEEQAEKEKAAVGGGLDLYVLSNIQGRYGASVLLYPGELHRIAEAWSEGFYIIPSSIHEVILIPEHEMIPIPEMRQIIHDINREMLQIDEILSGEVYYYDPEKDRLRIVRKELVEAKPSPANL